jgi:hypothetical protein
MTAGFISTFFYLTGGLIIWGVRFLAVYSFTGLACARNWVDPAGGFGVLQLVVGLASLVALAGCGALGLRAVMQLKAHQSDGVEENIGFIHYVAGSAAALAALSILLEALPFFLIPVCE